MYKDLWTRARGKKLKAINEPKNAEDKFAAPIMKNDCLVGHLPKEKTGNFAKIVCYFLHVHDSNICSLKITSKAINQADGKGMKLQYKSFFFN